MRKRMIGAPGEPAAVEDEQWLDLERLAAAELSSEDPAFPLEEALRPGGRGWRAALGGTQTLRLLFDPPRRVRRIRLVFQEERQARTQEFTLAWSGDESSREIVRQQYHFSPPETTREIEDYRVDLAGVNVIELQIRPEIGGGEPRASLQRIQIA